MADDLEVSEDPGLDTDIGEVSILRLRLTNFLSYKELDLDIGRLTALIGPNASGKSNAVAAIKLLRDLPEYGLPTALARRGGFDQLRHRSSGRPYDPAIRLDFRYGSAKRSYYELALGALKGSRYKVKREQAEVHIGLETLSFKREGDTVTWTEELDEPARSAPREFRVPEGQSALSIAGFAGFLVYQVLQTMQTIEVNPATVGELQEPSSTREFAPDGSNVASIIEQMTPADREELVTYVAAIVPGIVGLEVVHLADRHTIRFRQMTRNGNREFYAKQMSDGTLRALVILLAALRPSRSRLLVIEEPETAIHLGALRSLIEILSEKSDEIQLLITTHSADIVDALPVDALRVVWNEDGVSRASIVAEHTVSVVRDGLMTPGELLRSDALDPAALV